jgi:hypothetical protein
MKISTLSTIILTGVLALMTGSASALVVAGNQDANALARAIAGSGITISNATLSSATPVSAGTFGGGLEAVGLNSGVLLTTGNVDCAVGPNTRVGCSGAGFRTSLKFDFTSATGHIFFNYVFASEEYNEYVGTKYNDSFKLLLNGVNIALLPGGRGEVAINNINNQRNSTFFRDNTVLNLDTEYDGLTTVLTASATALNGINHFEFLIEDIGDDILDSGVFIGAGTFSGSAPVSEPATIALMGLGLFGFITARKRKK